MKIKKIIVKTNDINYPIIIGWNLISNVGKIINQNFIKFDKCLLLIDENVPRKNISLIKKSLKNKKVFSCFIKANEKNKNQKNINMILDILLNKEFSRADCLISIGGGITGDIGGFAASVFKRGLKFINIPTTLLAQVDSSIGGKTGINSKFGKNLIGSFYQPRLVISDINFLKTLPKREIVCGYGEIFKHSLIQDKKFFHFLDKNISNIFNLSSPSIELAIFKSCLIKKRIIEKDEKEKNLRKILNFGHTFAHAYEATLGYSKKLNHGEAVFLGINSALSFSNEKKLLKDQECNTIINHIKNYNLPLNLKRYFSIKDLEKILKFMSNDKKNSSKKINLILLKKIGNPIIKNYKKETLKSFLEKKLIN